MIVSIKVVLCKDGFVLLLGRRMIGYIVFNLYRKIFVNFDPQSVAKFDEKKLITIKTSGSTLLSEQKMCAVVENAKQTLKVKFQPVQLSVLHCDLIPLFSLEKLLISL